MKKITLGLLTGLTCFSTPLLADAIGVYTGAYYWQMTTEGSFSSNQNLNDFNFEDEGQLNAYIAFEHPVPLVPNAMIKRSTVQTSGFTTFNDAFFFDGVSYTGQVATTIDLTQTDFILYYEILDNDLITLDLGVNGKKITGDMSLNEKTIGKTTQNVSGVIPMLYGAVKVGLPFTGFSLYAQGSFVSVGDHSLHDAEAGINYQFVDNMAIDMSVLVGYRVMELKLEDLDDIYSDLSFNGIYAGIELHF